MTLLRAVTIHAPWAWAICHAGKRIENRSWKPPADSPRIGIHAGMNMSRSTLKKLEEMGVEVPRDAPRGALVATALVTKVVDRSTDPWYLGPMGWVLDDVRVGVPIPMRGQLGAWKLSDDAVRAAAGWK